MAKKKYIVTLTEEERASLEKLVNKGKNPALNIRPLAKYEFQSFN